MLSAFVNRIATLRPGHVSSLPCDPSLLSSRDDSAASIRHDRALTARCRNGRDGAQGRRLSAADASFPPPTRARVGRTKLEGYDFPFSLEMIAPSHHGIGRGGACVGVDLVYEWVVDGPSPKEGGACEEGTSDKAGDGTRSVIAVGFCPRWRGRRKQEVQYRGHGPEMPCPD